MRLSIEQIAYAIQQGSKISKARALELERAVDSNPTDIENRIIICSFLIKKGTVESHARRAKHSLWLIEHMPENRATSEVVFLINKYLCAEAYQISKHIWERHLKNKPNPDIIINAYKYFCMYEPELSQSILEAGHQKFPSSAELCSVLVKHYLYRLRHSKNADSNTLMDLANDLSFHYLSITGSGDLFVETRLAIQAIRLQRFEEASIHANRVLEAINYSDAYQGRFIQSAYTVLGIVALKEWNLPRAIECLNLSISIPIEKKSLSFAPSLVLARDLLILGHQDPVISFLTASSLVHSKKKWQYFKWILQIKLGVRTFSEWNDFDV